MFVGGAAFSLRDGILELIHPSATSSFAMAYVVLAISTVLDLMSIRQSAGQMARRARRYHREFLEESRVTSDPSLRAGGPLDSKLDAAGQWWLGGVGRRE